MSVAGSSVLNDELADYLVPSVSKSVIVHTGSECSTPAAEAHEVVPKAQQRKEHPQ